MVIDGLSVALSSVPSLRGVIRMRYEFMGKFVDEVGEYAVD